jgi:pyrimidine operon attenuation protein/uracil phosphoribosyltransferase
MDFIEKARIMDGPRINRALARLSSEVVEENHGAGDLFLVGIRRRGVPLAERMAAKIADLEGYRHPSAYSTLRFIAMTSRLSARSQS